MLHAFEYMYKYMKSEDGIVWLLFVFVQQQNPATINLHTKMYSSQVLLHSDLRFSVTSTYHTHHLFVVHIVAVVCGREMTMSNNRTKIIFQTFHLSLSLLSLLVHTQEIVVSFVWRHQFERSLHGAAGCVESQSARRRSIYMSGNLMIAPKPNSNNESYLLFAHFYSPTNLRDYIEIMIAHITERQRERDFQM